MKLPSSSALLALADELVASPRQKANHLPLLISALASDSSKAALIIQGLQSFFVACLERDDLRVGPRPKTAVAAAAAATAAEATYATWLRRQYAACVAALLGILRSGRDSRTQLAALAVLMEFVRRERAGTFSNLLFERVAVTAICGRGTAPEVVGALVGKYGEHMDVRYHLLRTLRKVCERRAARAAAQGAPEPESDVSDEEAEGAGGDSGDGGGMAASQELSPHDLARNVYDLLTRLKPPAGAPGVEEESAAPSSWCGAVEAGGAAAAADADGSRQRKKRRVQQLAAAAPGAGAALSSPPPLPVKWASPKLQRRAFSNAWLSFLRLSLPDDIYRKALARMHDAVIPHLFSPLLLSDFLTHSLDRGGLIGMLALNGIFVLVTRHGLEYPRFYQRMYGLLTPAAFQSSHRVRFFHLADIFLASGLVPAYTAAAFAKRFARLALRASPPAALIAIAFVHNIVRRHPACMQLLHRAPAGGITAVEAGQARAPGGAAAAGGGGGVWRGQDVYLEEEADPALSRALESSLWELTALRRHANPMVASYCAILDKDLTNRRKTSEVDIAKLLPASYSSLFAKEIERRLKEAPAAFYAQPPTRLFDSGAADDFPGWAL